MRTIYDPEFRPYGKAIAGYDTAPLVTALRNNTPRPLDHTIYVPSDAALEALPLAKQLADNVFGGMPMQLGYCNGSNRKLNCLEYHRCSEVNIPCEDIVLLVAPLQKVQDGKLSTGEVEAFLAPGGAMVLLYETTLHYAPCNGPANDAFQVAVALPSGTNTQKPEIQPQTQEDRLLWARNKWLIAHPQSDEARQGAFIGLEGENITLVN